jgi:REP element-mobilizing transposase RayT
MPVPEAYFITFRTYGTWLPGDERGTVDDQHNRLGTPMLAGDHSLHERSVRIMRSEEFVLTHEARTVVEKTVAEVCTHRAWTLLAVNARSNHAHVVVRAAVSPEKVMVDLKAWSTRRLVERGFARHGAKVWAEHGSTIYLWNDAQVRAKVDYVARLQDLPERFAREGEMDRR